jgi:NADH:ubiquinone oxidoreductase, NADH-binding (51 kD) subunit
VGGERRRPELGPTLVLIAEALVHRVLDELPVATLDSYVRIGGGLGLDAARRLGPEATIDEIVVSGVRGRGGGGFPTGAKWRTVAANRAATEPTTVVVNAAEGEPGSFKDRELLLRNPYRTLEGALVAAVAVGADRVIVGMKRSFSDVAVRVRTAIAELAAAGWTDGATIEVFEGPGEYLLGEETALLECIDGRYPFPRVTPPYRRGIDENVAEEESGSAAQVELAGPTGESVAPPCLVNNVETLAHCALILAKGAVWFRSIGTADSPGTAVCTVTGDTVRAGVGEVAMGTPLAAVLDAIGGGVREGRHVKAVMQGVAAALIPGTRLDTLVSWEGMSAIGSGLGSAAFIVFDDAAPMAAVAASASRFLAVESCGQCTPCKRDGLAIADALDRIDRSEDLDRNVESDLRTITDNLQTITSGARCSLATQHQVLIGSVLDCFGDELHAHGTHGPGDSGDPRVAPITSLAVDRVTYDANASHKQPDWTFDETWSGKFPADLLAQQVVAETPVAATEAGDHS